VHPPLCTRTYTLSQSHDLAAVLREVHPINAQPVTWESFAERAKLECDHEPPYPSPQSAPNSNNNDGEEVKCSEAVRLAQWWLSQPPPPPASPSSPSSFTSSSAPAASQCRPDLCAKCCRPPTHVTR
jgi:hypothetical protein